MSNNRVNPIPLSNHLYQDCMTNSSPTVINIWNSQVPVNQPRNVGLKVDENFLSSSLGKCFFLAIDPDNHDDYSAVTNVRQHKWGNNRKSDTIGICTLTYEDQNGNLHKFSTEGGSNTLDCEDENFNIRTRRYKISTFFGDLHVGFAAKIPKGVTSSSPYLLYHGDGTQTAYLIFHVYGSISSVTSTNSSNPKPIVVQQPAMETMENIGEGLFYTRPMELPEMSSQLKPVEMQTVQNFRGGICISAFQSSSRVVGAEKEQAVDITGKKRGATEGDEDPPKKKAKISIELKCETENCGHEDEFTESLHLIQRIVKYRCERCRGLKKRITYKEGVYVCICGLDVEDEDIANGIFGPCIEDVEAKERGIEQWVHKSCCGMKMNDPVPSGDDVWFCLGFVIPNGYELIEGATYAKGVFVRKI